MLFSSTGIFVDWELLTDLIINTHFVNFRKDWKYAYWAIVLHSRLFFLKKTGVTFAFFNSEGKQEPNKELMKLLQIKGKITYKFFINFTGMSLSWKPFLLSKFCISLVFLFLVIYLKEKPNPLSLIFLLIFNMLGWLAYFSIALKTGFALFV